MLGRLDTRQKYCVQTVEAALGRHGDILQCPSRVVVIEKGQQSHKIGVRGVVTLVPPTLAQYKGSEFPPLLCREVAGKRTMPAHASNRAVSQLNGTHGEYTNSDDVKTSRKKLGGKPKKTVRRRRQSRRGRRVGLTHCANKYFQAVRDPFGVEAIGACVPTMPAFPSQKAHAFVRDVTVTVGTLGVGYIVWQPCLANDLVSVWATASNFAHVGIDFSSLATGVLPIVVSDSPYAADQLTGSVAPVTGRLVSAGMRCRYTGTELNRGGQVYAYATPDHSPIVQDVTQGITTTILGQYLETQIVHVRDSSLLAQLASANMRMSELDSVHSSLSISAFPWMSGRSLPSSVYPDSTMPGFPTFVMMFTGVPGNTFSVDLIQHAEYFGRPCENMQTPNHTDSIGFEKVTQAIGYAAQASGSGKTWISAIDEGLRKASNDLMEEIVPRALAGLTKMAMRSVKDF